MAVASALSNAGTGTGISTRSLNNIGTGTSTEKPVSDVSRFNYPLSVPVPAPVPVQQLTSEPILVPVPFPSNNLIGF